MEEDMISTCSTRHCVTFENLCRGEIRSYCLDYLISLKAENDIALSFENAVKNLCDHIKNIFTAVEIESDRRVIKFTIGKSSVKQRRKPGGGFIGFDVKNANTWKLGNGANGRWRSYLTEGYDGLVVLCATPREAIADCGFKIGPHDYALALEQRLIHHFAFFEVDTRIGNISFESGGRADEERAYAGLVYVVYKLSEPLELQNDEFYTRSNAAYDDRINHLSSTNNTNRENPQRMDYQQEPNEVILVSDDDDDNENNKRTNDRGHEKSNGETSSTVPTEIRTAVEHFFTKGSNAAYDDRINHLSSTDNTNRENPQQMDYQQEPNEVILVSGDDDDNDNNKRTNDRGHERSNGDTNSTVPTEIRTAVEHFFTKGIHDNQRENMAVRTTIQTFKCIFCSRGFNQKAHLETHVMTHTGEKPFKCKECEKTFRQKSHLITHERMHSGIKPYTCDECNKSFSQSCHLTLHKRTHTGERPYKCETCHKEFTQRGHLKSHIKKLHKPEN